MRIPRVYTPQPLVPRRTLVLETAPAHHLSRVLRLQPGDPVRLFNGDGGEYRARIERLQQGRVGLLIGELLGREPTPPLQIHLRIGISRGERMEYALQKSVELGVVSIRPLFTERCVVRLQGRRLARRQDHWRRIVIGACEQSGRCRLPELLAPQDLSSSLRSPVAGSGLLLDHRATHPLAGLSRRPEAALTLLIGPEGGLSRGERAEAERCGYQGVRLGPRILRSETAPVAAIAAIQALWGDFRCEELVRE